MRKIAACCLVLLLTHTFLQFASEVSSAKPLGEIRATGPSPEIGNYRSWLRVNPEPLRLPASLDLLCKAPTAEAAIETSRNPHRQKFFTVYVNAIGQDAMMLNAKPRFPIGSIIVKEKVLNKIGDKVELLTAMVKRESGFNSGSGDWEYLVLDGTGANVEARGKLANCQSCHSTRKETDYVFRSYLANEVRAKLQ
jgi:hypothetical protein